MINKIAYNNTAFTGHLAIQAGQGKSVDDIISKIPNEEERIIFKEELDTFQKRVESETSDESNFILTLGHREWEAGNTLPSGHGITFNVVDTGREHNDSISDIYPITRKNGKPWSIGAKFQSEMKEFFNELRKSVVQRRNLYEAREKASQRRYH